ncbi:MAG: anti-sigma factor [bacterium]
MTDEQDLGTLIRDALPAHPAPRALQDWALAQARAQSASPESAAEGAILARPGRTTRNAGRWLYAAGLVAAAALGFSGQQLAGVRTRANRERTELVSQLVDTHVRSLLAEHLTDVLSTDQHTVKPWFAGKTPFAPTVVELSSLGFPLVGGRLDYVQGHEVATLVYGRRKHFINLFVWPSNATTGESNDAFAEAYHGFTLRHWASGGMQFWAVSDAAASEVEAFQHAYTTTP